MRRAQCERAAIRFAHEPSAGVRRIPPPDVRGRNRGHGRFGHNAREFPLQWREQRTRGDGDLDAAIAPARRRDQMLLVRGTGQLVLECKRRRRGDAVRRHRRQHDLGKPDRGSGEYGFAAIGGGPGRRSAVTGAYVAFLRVEQRPRVVARERRRLRQQYAQDGHGFYSRVCQTTTGHSRPSRFRSARACAMASPWRERTLTRK